MNAGHVPSVQSILDKFLGRFKTLMGPFFIPMFAVDDNPPEFEDGWTVPGLIDRVTKGIKVYVVNAAEIGGGGDTATLAKQEEQIAQLATLISNTTGLATETTTALIKTAVESSDATLSTIASTVATEATALQIRDALAPLVNAATEATAQDILAALGPLATSLDVQAVEDAITALGGGSTVDDIVTALVPLASVATETTAAAILSELQSTGLDVATIKNTLITIEDEVDDLETYTLATANNTAPSSSAPTNYNVTPTSETTTLSPTVCRRVTLIADDNNDSDAVIYVGGGSVDATSSPRVGTPLYRGDSVTYAVTNANLIRHASPNSAQVLRVEIIP